MIRIFFHYLKSSIRCYKRCEPSTATLDDFFLAVMIVLLALMLAVDVNKFSPWFWAATFVAWRQHIAVLVKRTKVLWRTAKRAFPIFRLAANDHALSKLIKDVVDNIKEFDYDLEQVIIDEDGDFGVTLQDLTKDEPNEIIGAFMDIETGVLQGTKPCIGKDKHRNFYAFLTLMEKDRHNG